MVGMDRPATKCLDRACGNLISPPEAPRERLTFDEAALVQGIGVYVHLDVVLVPHISRLEP
jgi:hypothetical protein